MVQEATGTLQQLIPDVEQMTDGESQLPSRVLSTLVDLEQPEKRTVPLPVAPRPPLPTTEEIAQQQAYQQIYGGPVLRINRYAGSDQDWTELVRWDIPIGFTGDLREIAIVSDNDEKTRYRVFLANQDQNIPTDRQTTSPQNWPWDRTILPGGTSCWIEVRSTDGTAIVVDATLTGAVR